MTHLLMITSDRSLAAGQRGAFYNTLSELHRHFDRIDVICPRVPVTRYDMSVFGNVFIHPSPWPLLFQWFWVLRAGKRIAREHRPDIMTVQEYAPVFLGVGAAALHRATGTPYLLEVMHVSGIPRASGIRERLYRWLLRIFVKYDARSASAVRVINTHETPDFLVMAGVPKEKIRYIPAFYIDLATYTPESDQRKEYDVIFVGRLARNKGLDLFLDAVRYGELRALIVGDGPLMRYARRRARRERISVRFHGYARDAQEVASLMHQSRLLMMTSLSEGGPRVVLEALACGVPVLATPVGIVPDVLPPEAIEQWNARDFADKAKNILQDSVLYDRLRQSGLQVVQQFERGAAIAAYAEALKSLIRQ